MITTDQVDKFRRRHRPDSWVWVYVPVIDSFSAKRSKVEYRHIKVKIKSAYPYGCLTSRGFFTWIQLYLWETQGEQDA